MVLREDPQNRAVARELASLLTQAQRYSEAAERYLALIDQDPDDRESRLSLARIQSWSGAYEESIRNYRLLLSTPERDTQLETELARVLSWSGRYPESIELYDDLIRRNGSDEATKLEYARVLSWSGRYGASSKVYREYLSGKDDGDHREERIELARVLSWGGSYEESRVEYASLIEEDPVNAGLHAELGDVYRWAGRNDLARSAYRTCLKLDETNGRAIEGLEILRMTWNRVEVTPGYDEWTDSEGFGLYRSQLQVTTHPWEITTLGGGLGMERVKQLGSTVDARTFFLSFQAPFLGKFKGYGTYQLTDYDTIGMRNGYTAKIEYLPNLGLTVGLVSSRNEIVREVFNIRSLTGGIIQSQSLMAYLLSNSRRGFTIELVGQLGDQTDDNRRKNGRAVLTYRIRSKPYIGVSYRLLYIGYRDRSDLYWDPRDYVSNMGMGHIVFGIDPVEFEVEGGIGRGNQDGVGNNEYSVVLGGRVDLFAGTVLAASYSRGRTGRLFEDSIYTFSSFAIRLTQRF